MEIFVDSANLKDIKKWMDHGILDGVTTNPTIMLRDGVSDVEDTAKRIADLVEERPLCVEVTTNDCDEMFEQARAIASWASNMVVKIPIINEHGEPCLRVVRRLAEEDVRVNVTAMLSFNQVVLAAKAGATYLSIFAGRVADEGHDPSSLISAAAKWTERWGYGKILVGSMRGAIDVQTAAAAGAHVLAVPPAILSKMADHKYSRDTVRQFNTDAMNAVAEIERLTDVAQ